MLAKTITYTDFNGVTRKEEHHFNLSKSELAEMELSTVGGLHEMLKKVMETEDMPQIIAIFKKIILKSYGQKSADGKRFIKSEEMALEFSQTGAYDELFMELATNPDSAAAFINGVIPQEMAKAVAEAEAKENANNIAQIADARNAAAIEMRNDNN